MLSIQKFHDICREAAATTGNKDDELLGDAGQRALLLQLHYIGVVIAYGLNDDAPAAIRRTLLDPNWLTKALYSVLEHPSLRQNNGHFTRSDLAEWLDPRDYPQEWHEFILAMMQDDEIRLCFRLQSSHSEIYLVPAALTPIAKNYGTWPEYRGFASNPLRFRYKYESLPKDLITRFLVEAHNRLSPTPEIWATGATLQAVGCEILVIADLDSRRIDIVVDADPKSYNRRRDALNRIQDDFEKVHVLYPQSQATAQVPLPDQPDKAEDYYHLLKLEQRRGREYEHWPAGAHRPYKVYELLDGVRYYPGAKGDGSWSSVNKRPASRQRRSADNLISFPPAQISIDSEGRGTVASRLRALYSKRFEDEYSLPKTEASIENSGYGETKPFSVKRYTFANIQEDRSAMKILFLAANPSKTAPLDLEEELRSLEFELRGVKFRDSIQMIARHAVRPDDLVRYVRAEKPNIIHFSGHGSKGGIILRTDSGGFKQVDGTSLKRFLEGRGVELVVLNACYSKEQAENIVTSVKSVVGTTDAVNDEAARRFSVAFYRTLGDGLPVAEAFRDGVDATLLHGFPDVFYKGGLEDLTFVS